MSSVSELFHLWNASLVAGESQEVRLIYKHHRRRFEALTVLDTSCLIELKLHSQYIIPAQVLSMSPPSSQLGNLLRLTPLHHSDLPAHPSLTNTTPRPELLPFILTLLSQGSAFLSKETFPAHFTHHSIKTSKEASENVPVEVHKLDVPSTALQSIDWEGGSVLKRRKPTEELKTEHWFTRHSRHLNILSTEPEALKVGGASWKEFVFGL